MNEDRPDDLPPQFWTSPDVTAALATCDIPELLELIRQERHLSQSELSAMLGYSQSWISRVIRNQQALTISQAREIAGRLGVPLHLLQLGRAGGDDPTRRRDFGKALVLTGLAATARASVPADEATTHTLMSMIGAQRRLDATVPSRELAPVALAHVNLANRILTRAKQTPHTPRIAAAASEAAGFSAWLHADLCDSGTARANYHLAINHARRSGRDLLAVYMVGSLAAFEIDANDPGLGLILASRARHQLGADAHPTAHAWLSCIEALGHATDGRDPSASDRAFATATKALDRADRSQRPPWPWVFAFDHAKLSGYRALAAVGLNRPTQAESAFSDALPAMRPAAKPRAMLLLGVATTRLQLATYHRESSAVDEAFTLASDALETGLAYSSQRVIQRARQFRRAYAGPATPAVQRFDHRMKSTLP